MSVIYQFEITELELLYVFDLWIELKQWEWVRCARELGLQGFNMVGVDVAVSESVDEFATFETTDLGEHASHEGVGSNVEGNSEAQIA